MPSRAGQMLSNGYVLLHLILCHCLQLVIATTETFAAVPASVWPAVSSCPMTQQKDLLWLLAPPIETDWLSSRTGSISNAYCYFQTRQVDSMVASGPFRLGALPPERSFSMSQIWAPLLQQALCTRSASLLCVPLQPIFSPPPPDRTDLYKGATYHLLFLFLNHHLHSTWVCSM